MTKEKRHAAIRERAAEAIRDLYHNATPSYPRNVADELQATFNSWMEDAAMSEIEYIQSGGAYAKTEAAYRKTLEAPCNAGRFKSEKARAYYVRKGMKDMREERARCNSLDSREHSTSSQWERINEYGKLYTYGRGGRTLAPDGLIRTGGGSSFRPNEDWPSDRSIADCVDLIRIVESFNRYVAGWCKAVPEMWKEFVNENYGLGVPTEEVAELSTTD